MSTSDVITSVRAAMIPAGAQLSLGHDANETELWSAPVLSVEFHPDCRACTTEQGGIRHDLHAALADGTAIGIRDRTDAIRYRRPWDAPRTAAAA